MNKYYQVPSAMTEPVEVLLGRRIRDLKQKYPHQKGQPRISRARLLLGSAMWLVVQEDKVVLQMLDIASTNMTMCRKAHMNKFLFEEARKLYPGRKRGLQPEWDDFVKKHKKRIDTICPKLKPAIEKQIAYRATTKEWCPQWKNFKTWLRGSWWTEVIPQTNKPKPTKCGACGKPSTHGLIVSFEDGSRTIFRCDDCPDPEPDWRKREMARGM